MSDDLTDSRNWETFYVAPGAHDQLMGEKDAEIERLKEEIRRWEIVGRESDAEIEQLKALLAECVEALEHESWVSEQQCGLPSQFQEIIQKVRKAVK